MIGQSSSNQWKKCIELPGMGCCKHEVRLRSCNIQVLLEHKWTHMRSKVQHAWRLMPYTDQCQSWLWSVSNAWLTSGFLSSIAALEHISPYRLYLDTQHSCWDKGQPLCSCRKQHWTARMQHKVQRQPPHRQMKVTSRQTAPAKFQPAYT